MNQPPTAIPDNLYTAEPLYTRSDTRQREIVDRGLAVQQSSNTMSAFEYLRARDVDRAIIERVLLERHLRRLPPG